MALYDPLFNMKNETFARIYILRIINKELCEFFLNQGRFSQLNIGTVDISW